jgi:hypothetical protein
MTERIPASQLKAVLGKQKAPRTDVEGPIHVAILAFLRWSLPDAVIHHSPNEVDMSGRQAARMVSRARDLGMRPGWPDIEILWRGRFWTIEVKAPDNHPTRDQRECGTEIIAQGGRWGVARSVDDARRLIGQWIAEPDAPTVPVEVRGKVR